MLRTDVWAKFLPTLASCLVVTLGANAALAQDSTTEGDEAENEVVLEEVIITGVRRAMDNALNVKRESSSIVDAISYDDIASLPALDLGEALQAIPGVQVNREGERRSSEINLRGLPGGFVKVTANGQGFATPSRSTTNPLAEQNPYGAFDARVFDGVTVIKTPTAEMQEGGIAGTIDKHLANALSKKDGKYSILAGARYEELNSSWDPEIAVEVSKHIIPDELAFVFKFAWSEQNFRRDSISNNTYQNLDNKVFPDVEEWKAANGIAADDVVQYGRDIRQFTEYNEGDRLSFVGGLEWAPNDELKLGMDLLYTRRDMDNSTLQILGIDTRYRNKTGISITPIGDPVHVLTQDDGTDLYIVPEYAFEHARYTPGNRPFTFFEEARGIFLDAEWQRDAWTVDGAFTFSDSSNEFLQNNYQTVYLASKGAGGIGGTYGSGVGNMSDYYLNLVGWEAGANLDQTFAFSSSPADDLSVKGADGKTNFYVAGGQQTRDREQNSVDANARYAFSWGDWDNAIKFGARYSSEDLIVTKINNSINGALIGNISGDLYAAPYYVGGTDFFGGNAPGFASFEEGWLSFDTDAYTAALQPVDNPDNDPLVPLSGYRVRTLKDQVTVRDLQSNFDSSLDITAAYLMADFATTTSGGKNIWGNVGVRYVDTGVSADGVSLDNGNYTVKEVTNDYSNWLPSLNYNMTLAENLILRAAYNETMVRPSLVSFSPSGATTENDNSVNIVLPGSDLNPYTAKSYDLSLEWYNRKGSAITVAVYQKDIKSFFERNPICPEDGGDLGYGDLELVDNGGGSFTCYISEPYDPGTGEDPYQREMRATETVNTDEVLQLRGLEISIQQNLDFLSAPWNGFGGIINYSRVETDDDENILPGISPVSYNLIGYWENKKVSLRLAYNYRDEYVLAGGGSFIGFEDRYVAARGQLDMSVVWRVTNKFQLIGRGYNLTENIYEEYLANEPAKVRRMNWDGRTWALYAQYTF
jgi:iron complex outermembrane receptor protein